MTGYIVEKQHGFEIFRLEKIKVLHASTMYLSYELSYIPFIRNIDRNFFIENATLSILLTEEGKIELDVYYKSYRIKRIAEKPLNSFDSADCFRISDFRFIMESDYP